MGNSHSDEKQKEHDKIEGSVHGLELSSVLQQGKRHISLRFDVRVGANMAILPSILRKIPNDSVDINHLESGMCLLEARDFCGKFTLDGETHKTYELMGDKVTGDFHMVLEFDWGLDYSLQKRMTDMHSLTLTSLKQ